MLVAYFNPNSHSWGKPLLILPKSIKYVFALVVLARSM